MEWQDSIDFAFFFFFFFSWRKVFSTGWNYVIRLYICWRSRDELISDVLLWTPTHGRAKAGRPARTYIQQLCEDTGCWPEDLPEAMNDREKWRERVRDIRATSTTWWWWWCVSFCGTGSGLYIYHLVIWLMSNLFLKWSFFPTQWWLVLYYFFF